MAGYSGLRGTISKTDPQREFFASKLSHLLGLTSLCLRVVAIAGHQLIHKGGS